MRTFACAKTFYYAITSRYLFSVRIRIKSIAQALNEDGEVKLKRPGF